MSVQLSFRAEKDEALQRWAATEKGQILSVLESGAGGHRIELPGGMVTLVLDLAGENICIVGAFERPDRFVILSIVRAGANPNNESAASESRKEALDTVAAGIGKRPDLPTGIEYVKGLRGMWRGLAGGRRTS